MRFYFVVLAFPEVTNPGFNHQVVLGMNELIRRIRRSQPPLFAELVGWAASWPLATRKQLLETLQECMSMYLEIKGKADHYVAFLCDPLALLHAANAHPACAEPIDGDAFYNRTLTRSGCVDLKADYDAWCSGGAANSFSFCAFPFLLDPVAKRAVLSIEKDANTRRAAQPNMARMMQLAGLGRPLMYNPFFVIRIRRAHVLQDALQCIARATQDGGGDFYKELKVVFDGEEGVDQGGVRKEFFQLVVRECFDVAYGTFVYNAETRCFWFNRAALEQPQEYQVCSLQARQAGL